MSFSLRGLILASSALVSIASACSGSTKDAATAASGKSATAGNGASSSGGSSGGSNSAGTETSGGSQTTAGANAGGASSRDPTACTTADDCVIANVFSGTGCCTRTDCGSGLNREWVLHEPCASANEQQDPVPDSCSKGCQLCPASHCPMPVGVLCNAGKCQAVTEQGPCASDADCEQAIDYTSLDSCCSCPHIVSKAYDDAEDCVALPTAPKPQGCSISGGGSCDSIKCDSTCPKPKPTCMMGVCVPG